jgi:hypothetical protein
MSDCLRTPNDLAIQFRENAKDMLRMMLRMLVLVKEDPSEAPGALRYIDHIIAIMQSNQASMIESGKQLVQPLIDNALRVRSEIAAICPKSN